MNALPPRPRHPGWLRHARVLLLPALLGVGAASGLLAAPLPRTRALPVLQPLAPNGPVTPLDVACGSAIDALPSAFAAQAEYSAAAGIVPLPTPNSADMGEIAVLEDDGTFFFTDKGGNNNVDIAAVGRAFYRTHGDDYDELAVYLSTGMSNWLGSPSALAAAWLTRNDIFGIGLDLFDYNASLGLPPRLHTVLTMNGLQRYPDDPAAAVPGLPNYVTQEVLAHEFGHAWLAYPLVDDGVGASAALLGRARQHWGFFFDAEGSVMEGTDWNVAGPDTFFQTDPIVRFGPLDQYLMGVRGRDEVDSMLVVSDTARFDPPGPYIPISDPAAGITASGPAVRYGIDQLEAVNGPRFPDAALAPHHVRVAFVLLVPRGTAATSADLAKLETVRAAFPATIQSYTAGRMTLDATLDSRPGKLRIELPPLADTEDDTVPRAVGVRIGVDAAGLPIRVHPFGVYLGWRTDPSVWWTIALMTQVAPDSFAAPIPAQPAGTTVEYWIRANADSVGLFTDLPDLSRSPAFSYRTGPDTTAPRITHWAVYEQSSERMPQPLLARVTDNLGVDSVWVEWSLADGPLQSSEVARVGRDSFQVALGAGAPRGTAIAYRFVARDRSAAGNLGYSNATFDTLHVSHDWVDDFWNPAVWLHSNVRFNRRDEWHTVETPASPSGSGAWHCGLDGLPYGPYQDAALASGLVYDIVPGCSLTFVHRYELEDLPGNLAFDGARVEVLSPLGVWEPATPTVDYTHIMAINDQGLPQNAPCWSGRQDAWREESIDLSPWAPGPVRLRFRMSTDLFVGYGGWWIDQVRFHFPDQAVTGVGASRIAGVQLGPLWPNPASGALRQALRLGSAADVEWTLHDIAGRHVATLWHGRMTAGAHELTGEAPRALAGGLYFARVRVDGRAMPARRIAIVR
ncbi:MAG: hypothetical protein ABL977_03305 [Candidatus Eisenbacteria bacterium]